MSWASKSGNDWLTVADISEGISAAALLAIGSAPAGKSSNDWITRTEVAAWVQMGPSWWTGPDWATKGGVAAYSVYLPYSFTVYYFSPHSNYQCWAVKSDACTHSPASSITIYSASSSIVSGAVLYAFDGTVFYPRTWSTNGGGDLWLYDGTGGHPFTMTDNGGVTTSTVNVVDTCSVANYQYVMKGGGAAYGSCSAARAAITGGPTLFTNQASSPPWVADGTVIYTDAACTTPFNGGGSWYGLHPMSYSGEYACIISSSGVISSASNSC